MPSDIELYAYDKGIQRMMKTFKRELRRLAAWISIKAADQRTLFAF